MRNELGTLPVEEKHFTEAEGVQIDALASTKDLVYPIKPELQDGAYYVGIRYQNTTASFVSSCHYAISVSQEGL